MPHIMHVYCLIETHLFTRLVGKYLSDDQYSLLQQALARDPDLGQVIPGSGGIRKLRWAGSGRGKRGGLRIIYYVKRQDGVIWLLTMYPKNVTDDMSPQMLRRIREELDDA